MIKRCSRGIIYVAVLCAHILIAQFAQQALIAQKATPIKFGVELARHRIAVDGSIQAKVSLLDGSNHAAGALEEVPAVIELIDASGRVLHSENQNFSRGESVKNLEIPAAGKGIVEVRVRSEEMLQGGSYVQVTKSSARRNRSAVEESAVEEPAASSTAVLTEAAPPAPPPPPPPGPQGKIGRIPIPRPRPHDTVAKAAPVRASQPEVALSSASVDTVMTARDLEIPSAADPVVLPQIRLQYQPVRKFRADEHDSATIHAFLVGDSTVLHNGVRLQLFNTAGTLAPNPPMVIDMDDGHGMLQLSSRDTGNIRVELIQSMPSLEVLGEKFLDIPFGPPLSSLELRARDEVSLLEDASLEVRLLDPHGNLVNTDEDIKVRLSHEGGFGDLEPADGALTIKASQFDASAVYRPALWGNATFSVSAASLVGSSKVVHVKAPMAHILSSLLGGLLGGLAAFWATRARWWRIPLGALTGFCFYWAFAFGVLTYLPRWVVLNLLSALVLSALGGWAGILVFEKLLGAFGVGKPAAAAT